MTSEQIALVQSSFEKIRPIASVAGAMFYSRLFQLDESLKHLFKGDKTEQQRKLMATLEIMAKGLSVQEVILPTLRELGKRYAGYGVEPQHYATVGSALLWTLEKGLGEDFTPAVKEAWTEAYGLIASVMQEAAAEAADAAN